MEKNDVIEIEIVDMTEEGAGVGRVDGMAVFVSGGAVYGDTVSCTATKVKKNYALATLKEVLIPSKHRRSDVCPYISECGGCGFGALNYDAQVELKVRQLENKLMRIAGVENPRINPMLAGESLSYRNKAVMAVGQDEEGNPLVGFRSAKSHRIIDCKECRIQMPTAMAAAEALREFMYEYNATAFDERTGKGLIRHLMVRTAAATKKVMCVIVINGKYIPYAEELAYLLDEYIGDLEGDYILDSIVVSGDKSEVIAGKRAIRDKLMGLEFDISAESFYQVNSKQTEKLYEEALRMLDAKEGEKIIDIYCGIGTIGLIAASRTKARFLGIESVPQAIRDANKNAIRNLIVNAAFIEGKAEEVLPEMMKRRSEVSSGGIADNESDAELINAFKEGDEEEFKDTLMREFASPDAVILDPPRAGCARELLDAVIDAAPKRIVYVSCDQGTMARDVKIFMEAGYTLKETTPCDMFPETGGLESVSLLIK